ncbi:hypothetical protein [Streptomyces sp. CS090A]|uniref:hypothetical protein n=1 Tax=Streptomyces sp. CS090A TaxID=2162710 RepID=UPI0013A54EE4|nr:hypothetical protein [Streptomyces sp. CS090A]
MAAMEDVTAPWTMVLNIGWRPTPRVYEGRNRLLLLLESQKRLRAFKTEDEVVRAMVSRDFEIMLSPAHIAIADASGTGESEILSAILDAARECVNFKATSVTATFQHLIPIGSGASYEAVRSTSGERLFGSLAKKYPFTDAAILVDGKSLNRGTLFRAEFGIVDREESLGRLTQTFGRIRNGEEPDFSHVNFSERQVPDVGLYVVSNWHRHEKIPVNTDSQWFVNLAQQLRAEAGGLAEETYKHISADG